MEKSFAVRKPENDARTACSSEDVSQRLSIFQYETEVDCSLGCAPFPSRPEAKFNVSVFLDMIGVT
jgi:hypothetical protein